MKIAFTSCMCEQVFHHQPVWEAIQAQQPDYLILLGDSIYMDIHASIPPGSMIDSQFQERMANLYLQQIQQPQFKACIQSIPRGHVYSIWDDHDFLWNDANGGDVREIPAQQQKIHISTAFQRAFRHALAHGLEDGSFPINPADLAVNASPLETPSIQLAENIWLHLCDVRSFRTRTWLISDACLLGSVQRSQILQAVQHAPEAVHLLATGSPIASWKKYATDLKWLLDMASQYKVLALSGDIHRNAVDIFQTQSRWLYEATSSGAAVCTGVFLGSEQQNFGLLDIQTDCIQVRLFHFNQEEPELARTYHLNQWQNAGRAL